MLRDIFATQRRYFEWRIKRIKGIEQRFPIVFNAQNKIVLDIGCGAQAPLSFYLSNKGAKVIGGEISKEKAISARQFLGNKTEIVNFCAERLPFREHQIDIAFFFDVLEHLKDPYIALKEAKRVVRRDGLIFVEFSPYWAYPSGHHLYSLGFPNGFLPYQVLPIKFTKAIVLNTKLRSKDTPEFLLDVFCSLNKISIRKFRDYVTRLDLKQVDEKYLVVLPNTERQIDYMKYLPFLNELVTISYSCILRP